MSLNEKSASLGGRNGSLHGLGTPGAIISQFQIFHALLRCFVRSALEAFLIRISVKRCPSVLQYIIKMCVELGQSLIETWPVNCRISFLFPFHFRRPNSVRSAESNLLSHAQTNGGVVSQQAVSINAAFTVWTLSRCSRMVEYSNFRGE